tara:strand:- start:9000 stop:10160 length:1161 start_codon:yes stop_codon:yes gene_type:complete
MGNQYLIIALVLVSLLTVAALLLNWASNKQIPGLLRIAVGFMVACVGILLLSQQGELSVIITVFLANILIIGGRIPILFGLASFWNQETSKIPLLCLVWSLVSAVGFYYFTFIDDALLWRVRIFTVAHLLFSLSVVYVLANGIKVAKKLHPVTTITTNFGAYILIAHSAFNTIADSILLISLDGQAATSPEEATNILLLGAIVNIVIFTISILIMTMEELKIEHQEDAIFDPITTILNERTFIEVSNRVLGVALRYTKPVSMLTIELTNLDDIIEQHGSKVGNEVLRHFALTATDRRRNEDVLARSSHNQFRMLLPGVDEAGANIVIQKIKDAEISEEYNYLGNPIKAKFLISAITKREEDLHLHQMLQEGEVEIFKMKLPPMSPA